MMLNTPEAIRAYRLAVLAQALRLEIAGMHRSRGRSAYAIVKAEFGFRGSREAVLAQLVAHIA